jgi:hypothetical protein
MARFVLTARVGSNGVSVTWRDTQTGYVGSFTIEGPKESARDPENTGGGAPRLRSNTSEPAAIPDLIPIQ